MADIEPRQDGRALPNPRIVPDLDPVSHSPFAKGCVDLFPHEIFVGPVGDLVLSNPLDRVGERIDRGIGGNAGELADLRINRGGVPLDVGVIAERAVRERHALADLGKPAELRTA